MGIAQHTPGPLSAHHQPAYCQSGDGLDDSIMREDGTVVALIHLICGTQQDVKLWAAAPDLLTALKWYVAAEDDATSNDATLNLRTFSELARAAIAKATGEQP